MDPARVDAALAAESAPKRRRAPGIAVFAVVVVLMGLVAWRVVPHPVGSARTFGKYQGKAVTTAKSAESEVQTLLLVARTASAGNAFGPYTAGVVSDSEDGLSSLQGTFDSIQPPDTRADKVGSDLDAILGSAVGHARDLRIAARRGQLPELRDVAEPLDRDAKNLQAFQDEHQ